MEEWGPALKFTMGTNSDLLDKSEGVNIDLFPDPSATSATPGLDCVVLETEQEPKHLHSHQQWYCAFGIRMSAGICLLVVVLAIGVALLLASN